jgi:hypothetical protein
MNLVSELDLPALLEARRAAPADDLISDLLAARADGTGQAGGRLSAAECVQLVANLLAGDIDTTAGQLAHAVRLFAEHPGQWALLADDPGLLSRAVDEVLRFEPVTPFTAPRTRGLALDGPPQLGGVEGIYGIDKLPTIWSGSSAMSPNHGPAPDVS